MEIIILLSDPVLAGMFVQLASSLHLPLILLHRHNGAARLKVCITYNNTPRVCPECLDNICHVDSAARAVLWVNILVRKVTNRREARPG